MVFSMLKINTMTLVANANCYGDFRLFEGGNGQRVKECLLCQSVKSCDTYATDILHLLNGESLKCLLGGEVSEIDIYFRKDGIEWIYNDEMLGQIPQLYRKTMKLHNDGNNILLYEGNGNC
jgi:hypothetical protein